jgi:protein tyrosine/serine phosphatase
MPDASSAARAPGDHPNPKPDKRKRSQWSWPNFTRNALLIGGGIALLTWFVVEGVVPNLFPKNFGIVREGEVYRSGRLTPAAMRSVIEDHGIRTIVDLGAFDKDPAGDRRAQAVADSMGVRREILLLEGDARGDPNRYAEALRIISDPEAQPVLVHCAAGAQRTGCTVALYRHIVEGWDAEKALAEATDYRHDPEDNPHLRIMFETWHDEIARALEDGGRIEVGASE